MERSQRLLFIGSALLILFAVDWLAASAIGFSSDHVVPRDVPADWPTVLYWGWIDGHAHLIALWFILCMLPVGWRLLIAVGCFYALGWASTAGAAPIEGMLRGLITCAAAALPIVIFAWRSPRRL
ncbi:MAG: hypothetical protein N2C14_02200, partial [Planctomycetales bacterium]